MQHILQTALASGFSATEGFHSSKPNKVDASFDGQQYVLPQSFVPKGDTRITLRGKNGNVEVPWVSIGAWPWGDTATWHWKDSEREGLPSAWKILRDRGLNYIDTAQAYGSGETERICGDLVHDLPRDSYIMQTKYYVVPDNPKNLLTPTSAPVKMLKESLERLRLDYVDVYMVHGHIHAGSIKQVATGMADCVDQGLAKVIAVANYSAKDMLQMRDALAERGVPLALNQCEYNLLRRLPETDGLLKTCRDNDIQFQSYSSLAQSRLTGKWNADNEPPKSYRFSSYPMKELESTLAVLRKIADKRGVPMAAAALNYNIGKGVLPVAGMRNEEQAKSNLQALGWRLTDDEYKELDDVSIEGKYTILWQQG